MKKFIKTFPSFLNSFLTRGFFYVTECFDPILVFLNTFWVYTIFIALLIMIALKIFMGFVLGSHIVGKFFLIFALLRNSSPFADHIFRDFKIKRFSWSESCLFLVFSIQVISLSLSTIYDVVLYFLYHRHGLPCNYLGEHADKVVENILLLIFNFFKSFFI